MARGAFDVVIVIEDLSFVEDRRLWRVDVFRVLLFAQFSGAEADDLSVISSLELTCETSSFAAEAESPPHPINMDASIKVPSRFVLLIIFNPPL